MAVPGPGSETLVSVRSASRVHFSQTVAAIGAEKRARAWALTNLSKQAWILWCVNGCTRSLSAPTFRVTRREFRRAWYVFFLAWRCVATVEGTMTVTCTPVPLPLPGKRGDLPPVPPRDQDYRNAAGVIEIDLKGNPTGRLACGQGFDFVVTTSQFEVSCEGYSFAMLYREAIQNMYARGADLECGPDCKDKHYYIRAQAGSCDEGVARVVLHASVICLPPDAPREQGVAIRKNEDLRAPFSDSITGERPAWSERLSTELRPVEDVLQCPNDFRFWITLRATVDKCDAIKDFSPYVSYVQTRAAAIWHAIRCPAPPCEKWPLKELGAAWGCENGVVTVRYAFIVPCEWN